MAWEPECKTIPENISLTEDFTPVMVSTISVVMNWAKWTGPEMLNWLYVLSVRVLSCAQSCLTLCGPMGYSLPGSSVQGIFQARIMEWVVIPFSRGSSQPRDWTHVSLALALASAFFTTSPCGKQLVIYTSLVVISKKFFLQPSLTRNIGLESVCIWTSHFLSLSLSFLLRKMKRQKKCIKS